MTRSQVIAMMDSMGVTEPDSVIHFFTSSVHYAEPGVVVVSKEKGGMSAKGVFAVAAA